MARCRRDHLLGDAIGRYAAQLGRRVLIAGSGGISHEPPVPELGTAGAEVAERLIAGRNPSAEARQAAFAALAASAPYDVSLDYYRPIAVWIARFALMSAHSRLA